MEGVAALVDRQRRKAIAGGSCQALDGFADAEAPKEGGVRR